MIAMLTITNGGEFPDSTNNTPDEPTNIETQGSLESVEPSDVEHVLVTRVIDGDTIEIEGGLRVRYIGIDTPETVHPSVETECYGTEASTINKEMVEGKTVRLEKDVSDTDRFGRLLRYVWVDDIMVNEYLVREGYATVSTYPPDVKHQDRFVHAQELAREEGRGLWEICGESLE